MPEDKLQLQRFELKYRVNADQALVARDVVRSYLVLDEFSRDRTDNAYLNHSLYLDSHDLKCYWDVINSNKNRFKLRLRYYDDNPAAPVFFEIKRRVNDAILKQRGPVRREAVPVLLAGQLPTPEHLMSSKPQSLAAVQAFCRLMLEYQAVPKAHILYRREAWVSQTDNSVRVTMDRDVCGAPHVNSQLTTQIENPVMPFGRNVILELKFTGRFPNWLGELVRILGVMQCGAAKYADCVALLGQEQMNPSYIPPGGDDWVEAWLNRRRRAQNNLA